MTDFNPRFFIATIAQSKSIDFNNGTITRAKLTVTFTGNGDANFFMAADGTNFENVTIGTLHTFSTTGTDLSRMEIKSV